MVVETVAVAVWAMLPAYIPNNAAVYRAPAAGEHGGVEIGRASCRERV